ncbi:hypothetical protein ACFSQJ_05370 [Croceitalea marina]|uniref:TonB-dependent receptor plug domain-containing protein n=1 Tax=Croceitalea marina TaxID=1775166 RepID=A0ABW5MSV1_9FLAO
MNAKYLIFFLPILFLFNGFTQKSYSQQLKTAYEEHFQHQRETVYLHLNKTSFYIGEEVWWTAYIYDKKIGKPSIETTNLHCGIYDIDGNQIKEGLFLVQNGITSGSFKLEETLKSGKYFVRATTSWMQNFEEDNDFIIQITVINKSFDNPQVDNSLAYNLKILPEGGHIVKNTQCNIGVKLTNEKGKGTFASEGKVISSSNTKVADVYLNDYGLGKFSLPANASFPLRVEFLLKDGTIIKKDIPAPKEKGIVLNINNIINDKLFISLKTNQPTLEKIKGKEFYLAVHRDGLMAIKTFKINDLEKEIKIDKSKLLNGTNIITLFDEDLNPISERLVFNFQNIKIGKLIVERPKRKNKDSISFKINAFSKSQSSLSLSVSALPSETKAKKSEPNIISDFYLMPYLKSKVENPARYFKDKDRVKEYELDLVLLTQGWSSYKWDSIFMGAPRIEYPFENGISLSGTITSKTKKDDELTISLGDVANMGFIRLNDSTNFRVNNLISYNNDTLFLALRNRNKKLRKPEIETTFLKGFELAETNFKTPDVLNTPFDFEVDETNVESAISPLFVEDRTIVLNEVEVTEERIEKKLTRASPLINDAFTGIKIGEKELRKNPTLTQLINKNGFRVVNDLANNIFAIINTRPFSPPARVFIDDFLARPIDIKRLVETPLDRYDEIYFERNGLSGDVNANGGVIRIYTKLGDATIRPINSSFAEKLVENSFTRPKKFYRPDYVSYDSQDFADYGVVHWEPNLVTNEKGETTLIIPDNGIKNITLFMEGMAADGTLVSKVHEVSLD